MSFTQADIAGLDYVKICDWCEGAGQYEQTYTAGCGGGYFRTMGPCGKCQDERHGESFGLIYIPTGKAPPLSVVRQILQRQLTQSATLGEAA